ncbi:hypothetical protein [uncultured Tateyamaria sp.]|uniref:hypothetical protein n=1 Tax=uncultured Tateyamaria sp. TaxID=455651 RepID=UPI002624312A|nr:hypothetical protein [uncultured Tateyamaria sp.]
MLLALLLLPLPAGAGAWMRDEGKTFLSFGATVDEDQRVDGSIYVEHGLRPKLTLGFKADMAMDMTTGQPGDGTAFIFLRKPIPTGDRAYKLAYEVGVGGTFGSETVPLVRAGLSFGRGVTVWGKSGWVTLDTAVEWETQSEEATFKVDGTVGLTLSDHFQVMMQVFWSRSEIDQATTLAPSLIWRPKPEGSTRYQLGVESEEGIVALKLGLWRDF